MRNSGLAAFIVITLYTISALTSPVRKWFPNSEPLRIVQSNRVTNNYDATTNDTEWLSASFSTTPSMNSEVQAIEPRIANDQSLLSSFNRFMKKFSPIFIDEQGLRVTEDKVQKSAHPLVSHKSTSIESS